MNKSKRILLIDDDERITFGFSKYLQHPGVDVDCAHSLEKAQHCMATYQYDAAIIDLWLSSSTEIEDFVCLTRSFPAKDTAAFHLKNYKEMKRCKDNLSGTGDYVKTLEGSYIEEQASNYFARIFLEIVLQNRPYFAGSCPKDSPEDVLEIVKPRVKFYGLACIGKIPIYDSPWI